MSVALAEQSSSAEEAKNPAEKDLAKDSVPKEPAQKERPSDHNVAPLRRNDESGAGRKGALFTGPEANDPGHSPATGFVAIGEDLERRSREWNKMVRLLQHQRELLDAAEADRDATYAELERIMPLVQDTARDLETAMDACRAGDGLADLSALFVTNGEALDQLERVSVALTDHFLRVRSAWDQYGRSIAIAQRLRAEMHRSSAPAPK